MCDFYCDDVEALARILLRNMTLIRLLMNSYLFCRYKIVSTGGTASSLESNGVSVTKVEELTCFPEMVQTVYIIYVNVFLLNYTSTPHSY